MEHNLLEERQFLDKSDRCLICIDSNQAAKRVHQVSTGLVDLDNSKTYECWLSKEKVEFGVSNRVVWSRDTHNLVLSYEFEETSSLAEETRLAYESLLKETKKFSQNFKIARIWNYIDNINQHEQGVERYRQFNKGRLEGLSKILDNQKKFPAASGVGGFGKTIIFLFATDYPVYFFENPRQISAYEYPAKHGPASPSFSRASHIQKNNEYLIYLSGTASIVGHESINEGDIESQYKITAENIDLLLNKISISISKKGQPEIVFLKVYLRYPKDKELISDLIHKSFGDIPVRYLQGHICRQELDLEIEGVARL